MMPSGFKNTMVPSILVCSTMHSALNAFLILLLHRTCYNIVSGNVSGPQTLLLLLELSSHFSVQ